MKPRDEERFVDDWLDAALKERGAIEPRQGLEARILARARIECEQSRTRNWRWKLVYAFATAGLLLGTISIIRLTQPVPVPHAMKIPAATLRPRQEIALHTPQVYATQRQPHRLMTPLPRLDQFPSPEPLSPEEQVLARYLANFPQNAVLMARAETALFRQEEVERQASSISQDFSKEPPETNP